MTSNHSGLGAFRAIERAAVRWVIAQAKTGHQWASVAARTAYGLGWVALAMGVFLTGFGVVPLLGGAAIAGIAIGFMMTATLMDQRTARRLAMKESYPTDLHAVCAYIESRIGAVEAERLGDKGEVTLLLSRMEAMRAEAAALHRTIGQRVQQPGSGALLGEEQLRGAEQTLASLDRDLAELRQFADALRAAFTAARAEIRGLIDPQSDFNVRRRLVELQAQAGQAHQEVRALIAGSVTHIQGALGKIQSDLKELLVETGVKAALEIPLGDDVHASVAAQKEVIQTFIRRARALELPFKPGRSTPVTRVPETPGGAA
jgi:chromosome segregation ATPase